jgi:hypothetical protein
MGETKTDLLEKAEDLGVPGVSEENTKPEIEAAVEAASVVQELGPVVNDDGAVEGFEQKGTPVKCVQPQTIDDVPEALR